MKKNIIPYGRQDINKKDIDAVIDVLKSSFLTQGPKVPEFESFVSSEVKAKYAVACNSATSALHVSCMALGVKKGDIVWTSANTFVASANCAIYCGATVDFIDINPKTYNMDIDLLSVKLEEAYKSKKLPKVLIPVHLAGQSCDMEKIHDLSKKYGFKIIEDASHAIGGSFNNKKVGSCFYSDITVFSFHPVKIITSGEGGMALTNNIELDRKLRLHRSHGITSDKDYMEPRNNLNLWNYQQIDIGYNYRMTDIQAALGISQLERLKEFVIKRNHIADRYNELLKDLPVMLPFQHPKSYSSYHLYIIRINLKKVKKLHNDVYKALHAKGILANLHYIPVYRQPFYEQMGFAKGYCKESESFHSEALSIPMYPGLKEKDLVFIRDSIEEILN